MQTIPAVLDRAQQLFPHGAVLNGTEKQTYPTIYKNAQRIAGELADLGIGSGTVVAVADWNTPDFFELLYAITGLGATIYPVNLNLPPEQIGYTLETSDATYLLYSDDFEKLAQQFPGRTIHIDDINHRQPVSLDVNQDTPAITLFTSGTTGKPKPVQYTHKMFVQGGLSIAHQLAEYNTPASLSGEDTLLPGIPMFHLLSWGSPIIAPYLGADIQMTGQYDPQKVGELIEKNAATWSNMVPTMVRQLLKTDFDLNAFKLLTGGSTIQQSLVDQMRSRGIEFSTIYGGTDMLAASISIWTDQAEERGGYDYLRQVTHPVPFGEFRLVQHEGMDEDMGEIEFRAPWLPDGYYNRPDESKEAFIDGWFRTGDIGRRMSDGGVQILDRIDDAIKSGGEWIPTSVLESIIVDTDPVANAAVMGKPDNEWGERPVAAVTTTNADLDVEQIHERLDHAVSEGSINDWWIPDEITIVEELPLTSTGKIKKDELSDQLDIR